MANKGVEVAARVAFEKIAARVIKYSGPEYYYFGYRCGDDFHVGGSEG